MLKIAKSLVMIMAVAALAVGATASVFTSQAKVEGNTFATGVLEIRVNGQASISGFNFPNAAPCDDYSGGFTINNYGAPWFAGPSTLPAKVLEMSAVQTGGSTYLYDKLKIQVTVDAGGPPEVIFDGKLKNFNSKDALVSYYHASGLAAGNSESVNYTVTLPCNADNSYQGLSTTFDFVVDAASS